VVAGIGDGGAVAEVFKSMMAPLGGGAKGPYWLVPTPPLVVNRVTPSVRS
jgi:hypothetical protein